MAHHIEQNAVAMELVGRSAVLTALQGTGTRCGAGVACGLCVAQQLPTDGARGSPQDQRYASNGVLLLDQAGQCHPVFRLELLISSLRGALHLRTLLGDRCCTSLLSPPREITKAQQQTAELYFLSTQMT